MPVLGGVAEKMLDNVRSHFALSSDGRQIAFVQTSKQGDGTALVTANLDGTGMRELLTRPPDKSFGASADWSPDGSLIAVSAVTDIRKESREIFVVRVADGHVRAVDLA